MSLELRNKPLDQELGFPQVDRFVAPPLLSDDTDHTLRDYWGVLFSRKWIILACILIVVSSVAIVSFKSVPLFSSTARIVINRENSNVLGFNDGGEGASRDYDDDYTVSLDTQLTILQSEALGWQVIHQLQLDSKPLFAGAMAKPVRGNLPGGDESSPARDGALLKVWKQSLNVKVVPGTRTVEITFWSADPRMAASAANTLVNTYIEWNFKTKFESEVQTSDWLSQQLTDLQMKVESSEEALVKYQKDHGILGIDEKQNIVTTKLDELNKELTAAQADRIRKAAIYSLQMGGNEAAIYPDPNSLLGKLRQQQVDLGTQLARDNTALGPSHPKVMVLRNQLAQVESSIVAETKNATERIHGEYLTALQREKMLQAALEEQKKEANLLNESAIQYTILKREADSNRQLYDGLLRKLKEAGVSSGLRSSNIRVLDVARVPARPSKPNILFNLGLAFLLSLVGGIGIAFVVDSLDNKIRDPDQVESLCFLPSLGMIPMMANGDLQHKKALVRANRMSLPAPQRVLPNAAALEAYRSLRTSILLSGMGARRKSILITSPLPGEGKSTTALNIAIVMAQKGERTLLIDADMRKPFIHRYVGIQSKIGLSTLLNGLNSAEQVITSWSEVPNLDIMPAGPTPPNPAELLTSPAMRSLLEYGAATYEHVILDSPPALTVTDAVVLSVLADAVLLVSRAGATPRTSLRRTHDLMINVNARVLGAIVNGFDSRGPGYHYYSAYGGKYGTKYYHGDEKET
jgi:polysaccharide biosynthesis transport protein